MSPTSHLSLSPLQIDWPAPQDKKRECVAKGKNNQVSLRGIYIHLGVPALLKGTAVALFSQALVNECGITHFTLLNYILSSQSGGFQTGNFPVITLARSASPRQG